MSEAQELQNFANFLISKNILENTSLSPESETLSKFYQIFQGFQRQHASVADETFSATEHNNMEGSFNNEVKGAVGENQYEEPMPFETKAIFTLADFLK